MGSHGQNNDEMTKRTHYPDRLAEDWLIEPPSLLAAILKT